MKHLFFLSFPLTLFLVIGVSITALALPLLSSSPIRNTNLIFVFLLLYVLFNESGRVVWIAFASHALRELFSTTPFGIILAAGTLSILFSYWTLRYIFTNRSWYTAVVMSIMSISLYRILYILLLLIYNSIVKNTAHWRKENFTQIGWEILMTTFVVTLCYTTILYGKKWMRGYSS